MLARCRVHEVSQEWGCEWGSSYMNESIHSVSSHDCRFEPSRMRCTSLVITRRERASESVPPIAQNPAETAAKLGTNDRAQFDLMSVDS